LWPNGWMDQDGTRRGGGPCSRPHCARWGPSSPPQKGGRAPQFSACFYCDQTAKRLEASRCHLAWKYALAQTKLCQMGTQLPPKRGTGPQFSARVYCGQTAICIRIRLGTDVVLSLGNIVLDGDPAPPLRKGHSPPFFGRSLWPNGCMD